MVSLVGSYSNNSTTTGATPTRTVTLPATAQIGDLVVIGFDYQGSGTVNPLSTPPPGFVDLLGGANTYNLTSTTGGYAAYYKFVDDTDVPGTTTYSLSWQFTSRFVEHLSCWRGVDPVTPIDVDPVKTNTGTTGSTTKTIPAITPVSDNCVELALIGAGGTALSTTGPTVTTASGFTMIVQDGSNQVSSNVKNAVASQQYRTLGAAAAQSSANVTTSVATAGVTAAIALRPYVPFIGWGVPL